MSSASIRHVFEDEFWNKNMDSRLRGFPMMEDGFPWKIISIALVHLLLVKFWNPKFTKVYDLRPYLLIQNGFAFGCHGAGVAIVLLLSNMGLDGFDCSALKIVERPNEFPFEYVKSQAIVRLATVLVYLRMFMMTETIVLKIMTGHQPPLMRIANDISLLFFAFVGTKYLPGGPSFFFVLIYVSFYSFTYGYYTLKCGYNTNNNDHFLILKWKRVFIFLMFVWSTIAFGHSIYLNLIPSCNVQTNVKVFSCMQMVYSIGTFVAAFNAYLKLRKGHQE